MVKLKILATASIVNLSRLGFSSLNAVAVVESIAINAISKICLSTKSHNIANVLGIVFSDALAFEEFARPHTPLGGGR